MYQKLLLLPELSGTAITGTSSNPLKTGSRLSPPNVMPNHKLINEEFISSSGYGDEVTLAKIVVNELTASWTHVNI